MTGSIVSMQKTTNREHEIVIAAQKGVFFINIARGNKRGLTTSEVKKLDATAHFLLQRSEEMDKKHDASVFAQDLSQIDASQIMDTETDLNNRQNPMMSDIHSNVQDNMVQNSLQ